MELHRPARDFESPGTARRGPGGFPLGSLESCAAARATLDDMARRECICFPPDEPPALVLQAEIEAARAVLQSFARRTV